MATKVGPKGHIVIEKRIRDELGIEPGWKAVQRVVDGRLSIRFIPPEHNESLFGIFRDKARGVPPPTEEEMNRAVAEGIAADYLAKEARIREALAQSRDSPDDNAG